MSTPWGSPCCPSTAQGALPRWVEGQDLEGGHQKAPENPGLACCMVLSISSHLGPPDVLSSFHTTVGAEISRMLVAQHIRQCLRRLKATSTGVSLPVRVLVFLVVWCSIRLLLTVGSTAPILKAVWDFPAVSREPKHFRDSSFPLKPAVLETQQ